MTVPRHETLSPSCPVCPALMACLTLAALLSGCSRGTPPTGPTVATTPAAPRAIRFTDVTASSGVSMVMTSGGSPSTQILEVKGGGVGLIDYDRDGHLDIFVPNGATMSAPNAGPGCRLYRNLGDGQFEDATEAAGLDHRRWSMGVAVADYDGDGHDDIYICCFGPNVLLRNTGEGTFEDMTASAGVDDPSWSAACSFGDVDGDGDLDLYVVNYLLFDIERPPALTRFIGETVFAGPNGLQALDDTLYENLGNGTFRDISIESGINVPKPAYGLGAFILDLDGDGASEIFVGNDSMANFLFTRGDDGRFTDVAMRRGVGANYDGGRQATMGIALADVNADERADIYTTNFSSDTNTLHVSAPGGFFDDGTRQFGLGGISQTYLGWACGFFDFDHDADEDLLVFNGHVYPQARGEWLNSEYLQPPLLYVRDGNRFEPAIAGDSGPWLTEVHCDRAAAFGDLDGDGDVDVVVGELNGPVRVLRNDADDDDWLIVELRDERPSSMNRRGIGATIRLEAGGSTQSRWIISGGSFQSANDLAAHFGWPDGASEGALTITWPDGHEERVEAVKAGQRRTISRR